jgi:multiple sugar transport system permease protein
VAGRGRKGEGGLQGIWVGMTESAASAMTSNPSGGIHVAGKIPDRHFKYWIIAPAIFLLLLVGLFPLIYSLVVSFQRITMMEVDTSFAGLVNYAALFKDARLWESLLHTALITVIALPIELVLGMLMAQLFLERLPGRQIFVSLLVLPTIISPIVAGATWRLLFDNRYGPINQIIGWFAGEPTPLLWTILPNLVYPAILLCEIWQWTPFMFLILLAALSNVDKSLTEAAEIDGAGYWRTFFKIVLPSIWPVMAIAILIRGLDLVRIFDIIWALTAGGPGTMTETISIYTYVQGFQQFETSYTAAIAFLVIVLLTVICIWAIRRMGLAK